jgi:hypothetical protein
VTKLHFELRYAQGNNLCDGESGLIPMPYLMRFLTHENLPPGLIVLFKNGHAIWAGPINSPIEDVDCDTIMLNPIDAKRFIDYTKKGKPKC